jgi:hypothetical protein
MNESATNKTPSTTRSDFFITLYPSRTVVAEPATAIKQTFGGLFTDAIRRPGTRSPR